jgi:hypothetical protein
VVLDRGLANEVVVLVGCGLEAGLLGSVSDFLVLV